MLTGFLFSTLPKTTTISTQGLLTSLESESKISYEFIESIKTTHAQIFKKFPTFGKSPIKTN